MFVCTCIWILLHLNSVTADDGCGKTKGDCEYYGVCDRSRPNHQCVCPTDCRRVSFQCNQCEIYILKTSNKCFVLMFRIFIPRAIIICFLFQSLKMGRKLTSCIKMKYQNNNNEKFFHHTVLTPFVLINPFCI